MDVCNRCKVMLNNDDKQFPAKVYAEIESESIIRFILSACLCQRILSLVNG